MSVGNRVVCAVLESPAHRLLSRSTDVVRYRGRRSGTEFSTPTQYARRGDDLIILVGKPETKQWWRNFLEERELDVLVQGRWLAMTGRAVVGADESEVIAPLLDAYLERFPKVAKQLGEGSREVQMKQAVVVWCRPR
jgi:hypothetical protein